MRVVVIFEFEGVDANGEHADQIVEEISRSCETMQTAFDASACWVDEVLVTVEGGDK
jgi:hypothetical protein